MTHLMVANAADAFADIMKMDAEVTHKASKMHCI